MEVIDKSYIHKFLSTNSITNFNYITRTVTCIHSSDIDLNIFHVYDKIKRKSFKHFSVNLFLIKNMIIIIKI